MGHEIYYVDCSIPKQNPQELFSFREVYTLYQSQHPEFCTNFDERRDVAEHLTYVRYWGDSFPEEIPVAALNDLIVRHKCDLFIMLLDIWIFKVLPGEKFACPAITWLPIHFEPVEIRTRQAAELFDTIVCLSTDGVRKLTPIFPHKTLTRIPHCVDFSHFKADPIDVPATRRSIGVPEKAFMILLVQNNAESTERKSFYTTFEAFKIFKARHPEAHLYIHSRLDGAVDLREIIDYLQIPADHYSYSDQHKMCRGGYVFEFVVNLYKACDVLLNATCSEGFSVPLVEANSVGCPVIASNNTACPDNVHNGELADNAARKFVYQNTSYWHFPSIPSIVECLERVYNRTSEEKAAKAEHGIKMARTLYDTETVFEQWKRLLENPAVTRPGSRALPSTKATSKSTKSTKGKGKAR